MSNPTDQHKSLLNTVEAAAYIDVVPETLERWRPKRRGPKFIKIGSNIRYKLEHLQQWLEEQTVETTTK